MPFHVSPVDPRVTPGFEIMLLPAPTTCEYPEARAGDLVEVPDGRAVLQQPPRDGRPRAWVWRNYPLYLRSYERQFQTLQTFRSRYRQEAGQSPYVWVRDTDTKRLRRKVSQVLTVAASGSTTTVLQTSAVPTITDAVVEVLGSSLGGTGTGANQVRTVLSNTGTSVTVTSAFSPIPHGAKVKITGYVDDWFRVRVTDVSRRLRDEGGNVRYDVTRFQFVIDDDTYNDIG